MSKNHVLVTGGTGFIGQMLVPALLKKGYQLTLLTRNPAATQKKFGDQVQTIGNVTQIRDLPKIDSVINLAGEGILDKRWSEKRKQELIESRVTLTENLVAALVESEHKPHTFINGSAVGFYGDAGEEHCGENSSPGKDFAATLCKQWEKAANRIKAIGCRLAVIRIGVVLDNKGGALERMMLPFKFGLGGKLGSGKQWFPWIHRKDLCKLILFLLEDSRCSGVYNATAPTPITNKEFTQALAKAVGKPAYFFVPGLALKLTLGEAAILLLGGQNAPPSKALHEGFKFHYTTIEHCLKECVQ
ncbi:MAG: TIGR01777 family oxidoreductase [Pseudomonadales bacterium]|nr:TIGR01777 family oxidoreductase [Pseudomonadales bacterium]